MKKSIVITSLLCTLIAQNLMAGMFSLRQGDLLDTDKIDIELKLQSGSCPTKYPVQSIDCTYSESQMNGVMAQYIDKLSMTSIFTVENTFLLNISLNVASQGKGYAFDVASCTGLQVKVSTGSVITINKTGCVI